MVDEPVGQVAEATGPAPPAPSTEVSDDACGDHSAVAAAASWHASLTGEDAAALAAFDAAW